MKVYVYRCKDCETQYESEKRHPRCPNCGSADAERVWTPPAVIYKSSGFYKTDNERVG